MTRCDRATSRIIRDEIRNGTPNTPERIATMARADAIYAKFARAEFHDRVLAWIDDTAHSAVRNALQATRDEFRLPGDWTIEHMHPGHLLHFIKQLAERTLC